MKNKYNNKINMFIKLSVTCLQSSSSAGILFSNFWCFALCDQEVKKIYHRFFYCVLIFNKVLQVVSWLYEPACVKHNN